MISSPSSASISKGRNQSIDAMRFILFCAIALIHITYSETVIETPYQSVSLLNQLMRFAVPCFFMISGYFIPERIKNVPAYLWKSFIRLIPVFVIWELLYCIVNAYIFPLSDIHPSTDGISKFIFHTFYSGGIAQHLWFLPWLFITLSLFVIIRQSTGNKGALIIAASLYLIGLCIGPYHGVLHIDMFAEKLSKDPGAYTARNGPFFWMIFIALGNYFSRTDVKISNYLLIFLCILGFLIQFLEFSLLYKVAISLGFHFDCLLGTIVFSVPIFLLLKKTDIQDFTPLAARLGQLSLGLYCVHGFFFLVMTKTIAKDIPFDGIIPVIERLGVAVFGIFLSLAAISSLNKIKIFNRIIS